MKSLTFYQAGAFALDVAETTNGPDFTPILMCSHQSRSLEDDAPTADIDGAEVEAGGRADDVGRRRRRVASARIATPIRREEFQRGRACP